MARVPYGYSRETDLKTGILVYHLVSSFKSYLDTENEAQIGFDAKGSFINDVHQKMGPPCHKIFIQRNFFCMKVSQNLSPPSPLNCGRHIWMTPKVLKRLVLRRHRHSRDGYLVPVKSNKHRFIQSVWITFPIKALNENKKTREIRIQQHKVGH